MYENPIQLISLPITGGADRGRTDDLLHAMQTLCYYNLFILLINFNY